MSEQSEGGETKENTTMSDDITMTHDISDPPKKVSSESSGTDSETKQDGDDTSTKATEENDSDTTMESALSSDTKKGGSSDAETDDGSAIKDTRTQEEKDREAKEKEEEEKKRIEKLKIKYRDWPLKLIKEPHENDVMYGRGGGTNHHLGNKRYRKMVEDRKVKYVNSKRLDKPLVALEIIREWRGQWPPGRFLKYIDKTATWEDVGDKKAREKTSQALREKAPQIRKQQEKEISGGDDTGDKSTRFAEGTKEAKKNQTGGVKKAILARDHSLGREYLGSDEKVDLQGFTWMDPIRKVGKKDNSIGSAESATGPSMGSSVGPSMGPGVILPQGRDLSMGSIGSFAGQYPSVPDYYGKMSFGDQRREFSNGSLGGLNPPYLPPPPGGPSHQRSGSWTQHSHPPIHGAHHQRNGSWNSGGGGREHSFTMNPLQYTSTNQRAPMGAFEQRGGSGHWTGNHTYPPCAQQGAPYPTQPPPPGPYGGAPYPPQPPPPGPYPAFAYLSGDSIGTIGARGESMGPPQQGPYRQVHSPLHTNATPSPPYDAMVIAKTWSGGGAPPPPGNYWHSQYDGHPQPVPGADTSPSRGPESQHANGRVPRPAMVKRDTSNQNESYETKPSRIKKAALNRDQSATSNRLKQQYMPEVFNRDMNALHEKTGQIRLNNSPVPERTAAAPKPVPLMRQSTEDVMEEAMAGYLLDQPPPQPAPLTAGDRKNTMDQLGYDLIGDDRKLPAAQSLPKPTKLTQNDRLTTVEFNNIVNAPFPITHGDDENPLPL